MLTLSDKSYYGSYRTRSFVEIIPTVDDFIENPKVGIPVKISEASMTTLYYLLCGKYGNSHISYSDENQFLYALYGKIFQYGPTWEKRLDIQDKLRALSDDELVVGGKAIYNQALNPGTKPTTQTLEELTAINAQNTTNYKKSKMEAYGMLMELLETDVTEEFLGKFKSLFLTVVAPDYPLLYETEID